MKRIITSRPARLVAALTAGAAVAVAGLTGTFAAWQSQVEPPASTFQAGQVNITSAGSVSAIFDLEDMMPGDSVARCINITNSGSEQLDFVDLSGQVTDSGLADNLQMTVETGSGAVGGAGYSCTSFTGATSLIATSALAAFPTDAAPAQISDLAAGQSRSYRITAALPAGTPDDAQGDSAELLLTWKASS